MRFFYVGVYSHINMPLNSSKTRVVRGGRVRQVPSGMIIGGVAKRRVLRRYMRPQFLAYSQYIQEKLSKNKEALDADKKRPKEVIKKAMEEIASMTKMAVSEEAKAKAFTKNSIIHASNCGKLRQMMLDYQRKLHSVQGKKFDPITGLTISVGRDTSIEWADYHKKMMAKIMLEDLKRDAANADTSLRLHAKSKATNLQINVPDVGAISSTVGASDANKELAKLLNVVAKPVNTEAKAKATALKAARKGTPSTSPPSS